MTVEFATELGPTDEALIERLRARDATALEVLYERHARLAFGVALRVLSDASAAEDVVQEAFLALWRSAATFDITRGVVRGWLLTIVRNRAIDRLRNRAPTSTLDPEIGDIAASNADVWAQVSASLTRERVASALRELPAEQRQVIELAFWGGFTHTEIANITGAPLGTVKGRMRIGLAKLRGTLQDDSEIDWAGEEDD